MCTWALWKLVIAVTAKVFQRIKAKTLNSETFSPQMKSNIRYCSNWRFYVLETWGMFHNHHYETFLRFLKQRRTFNLSNNLYLQFHTTSTVNRVFSQGCKFLLISWEASCLITGNQHERKHMWVENRKLISEKILVNDTRVFNSVNVKWTALLETMWTAVKIMNLFFCANFPLYMVVHPWVCT